MAELKCLRCGTDMKFSGREKIQLGEESYHSGLWAMMTAESMKVDIYKCPDCGKIELFEPQVKKSVEPQSNWTCSECGFYNLSQVQTCQSCGVTRIWSEKQKKKK